jgi:hypothetical protein
MANNLDPEGFRKAIKEMRAKRKSVKNPHQPMTKEETKKEWDRLQKDMFRMLAQVNR